MQIESHKNRQNKKAKRLNSIRGTQRFTKPSQTNGGANIRINSEAAIPKLKNLAQEYIGVSDPYGFLTNLREALGIPNSQGASKYGVVTIPKEDGNALEASLRITNHNSDAETYITHNANYEYNLSILVRKNFKPNTFKPHNDVVLDEFVYYGKRMQRVENPLTQIINSIIGFLQSGVYNDTTGVAFKNTSPQTNDNNKLNCNTNMNKKLIRLTESDLHRIVKESVNRIINEIGDTEKGQRDLGALTAARFKGKKKGDWGEVAKKAFDERDKASNKAAKSGYSENEPWSSLKAWHKKRASMSDAYNDGYQKQVNESGFYPMEYDSKMGYYTPNGTVDGVDTYIDFDEMSFSELKALRDKYLEQVGHTPWNKIANARPDIFHAVNAIEEELEDRRERYREGDKSALA